MPFEYIEVPTKGEGAYLITSPLEERIKDVSEGLLYIFCTHTSCALMINEAYDPNAILDVSRFLTHLVPRDWPHYKHTEEGPDDSPSHIKSSLLQNSLILPIENGRLSLGTWQGVYLCEFRDQPKRRSLKIRILHL